MNVLGKVLAIADERARRLLVAAEAECLGYGGISVVSRQTGVSRRAIARWHKRAEATRKSSQRSSSQRGSGPEEVDRKGPCSQEGFGTADSTIQFSRDPESPLKWTCKSVRKLTDELQKVGHKTNRSMFAELLHEMGYSLQANKKTIEGTSHPDRNAQFEHINSKAEAYLDEEQPVISIRHQEKGIGRQIQKLGTRTLS